MTRTRTTRIAAIVLMLSVGPVPALAKGGGHGSGHAARMRTSMKVVPAATPAPAKPPAATAKQPTPATSATAAATTILLSISAVSTALPSTPVIPPAAAPMPALADPMPSLAPLAPLSPPVDATVLSGGTVRPDALPSSNPNSASPTETAPSIAGGGGKSLQDCMGFWDKATHMSKPEWRAACVRSMAAFPDVKW